MGQLRIGTAKSEMHVFQEYLGMLGYGDARQKALSQRTPLFNRAYCFKQDGQKLFWVNCELCYITQALKEEVLRRLIEEYPDGGYSDTNIMLTAQHTHAGPGGFGHYPVYNWPVPGFSETTLDSIAASVIRAIHESDIQADSATLYCREYTVPDNVPIAWNRSLHSYNQNHDVKPLHRDSAHKAIDRRMYAFDIRDKNNEIVGLINWFGVHATCISPYNTALSSENKGYAASFAEKYFNKAICTFGQSTAGDVSPYYHGKGQKKRYKLSIEEEHQYAERNGRLHFEQCLELIKTPAKFSFHDAILDYTLVYIDMSNIVPDPDFTHGYKNAITAPAIQGMSFLMGTDVDMGGGPEILRPVGNAFASIIEAYEKGTQIFRDKEQKAKIDRKYRAHGKKRNILECGYKSIAGFKNLNLLPLPSMLDPAIAGMKEDYKNGALNENCWAPHILPIQIFQIGEIGIIGFPGEITTISGKRLKETLSPILKRKGINYLIISSYANAYMGYVTTFEEYQVQRYEGGHTIYGQWTLAGFRTKFKKLAESFISGEEPETKFKPPHFSTEELNKRSWKAFRAKYFYKQ